MSEDSEPDDEEEINIDTLPEAKGVDAALADAEDEDSGNGEDS